MGTPLKVKSYNQTKSTMPCGIHKVTIINMKMARDHNHQLIGTKTGEMAIDITFENTEKQTATNRFWTTDKAMWMINNLCKAVGVNNDHRQVDKAEMVGKELWLLVGAEYTFEEDDLHRDSNGIPIAKTRIIPKFYPVLGEMKPLLQGDPERNNGIPGGDFLLNKDLDLQVYWNKTKVAAINHGAKVHESIQKMINKEPNPMHHFNAYAQGTGLREVVAANPGRIIIAGVSPFAEDHITAKKRMQPNPNANASPFKSDKEIRQNGVKVIKTTETNSEQQFNDEF